jgi:outer membrane protein assembly factor BamB
MVFVGLRTRVAALNGDTGEILWQWKAPKAGLGNMGHYVSLLVLDTRRLIVSVNGYTYCLDPATGTQLWFNELTGFGSGVATLAALNKHGSQDVLLGAAATTASAAATA